MGNYTKQDIIQLVEEKDVQFIDFSLQMYRVP